MRLHYSKSSVLSRFPRAIPSFPLLQPLQKASTALEGFFRFRRILPLQKDGSASGGNAQQPTFPLFSQARVSPCQRVCRSNAWTEHPSKTPLLHWEAAARKNAIVNSLPLSVPRSSAAGRQLAHSVSSVRLAELLQAVQPLLEDIQRRAVGNADGMVIAERNTGNGCDLVTFQQLIAKVERGHLQL